jgi:hypothetical protein
MLSLGEAPVVYSEEAGVITVLPMPLQEKIFLNRRNLVRLKLTFLRNSMKNRKNIELLKIRKEKRGNLQILVK